MKKKITVFVLLVLIAAAGSFWLWGAPGGIVSREAVVRGRVAAVSVPVSGTVKEVYVKAGDAVAQGQPLLALDTSGMERRLAQERARLVELAAQLPPDLLVPSPGGAAPASSGKPLAALQTEEETARRHMEIAANAYAAANAAYARLDAGAAPEYAQPDPRRQAALITRDEAALRLRDARNAYEKASYARAQRETQEKRERSHGPVSAALAARIAEYQLQLAAIRLAEQEIADAVLTAPENGVVAALTAGVGNTVQAGDAPVTIAPEEKGEVWVLAAFAGEDASRLAEGLECEISLAGSAVSARGKLAPLSPDAKTEKGVAARVILDQNTVPAAFAPGDAVSVLVLTGGDNPLRMLLDKARAILMQN